MDRAEELSAIEHSMRDILEGIKNNKSLELMPTRDVVTMNYEFGHLRRITVTSTTKRILMTDGQRR